MKKGLLFMVVLTCFAQLSLAAMAALMMPVKFTIENGDFDKSTITIHKNGNYVTTLAGQHSFKVRLEYGSEYLLAFTKPGYITKKIRVNTIVPEARKKNGFDPYKIGVRIFKQYDGVNIVVYNQPVAYIRYHTELDEFAYDVDYTKSILSDLTFAENALERKAMEERKMKGYKPPQQEVEAVTTTVPAQPATEVVSRKNAESIPAVVVPSIGTAMDDKPAPVPVARPAQSAPPANVTAAPDSDKAQRQPAIPVAGDEQRSAATPITGSDAPPAQQQLSDADKPFGDAAYASAIDKRTDAGTAFKGKEKTPTVEQRVELFQKTIQETVEANRTITTIQLQKGSQITEYRRIFYKWGGQFYFENGTKSIPATLFDSYLKDPSSDRH